MKQSLLISRATGLEKGEVDKLIGRKIRLMQYKGIEYAVFRYDIQGFKEGTTVILVDPPIVVPAYPSIRRLALLEYAVKYMPREFFVEEKMNGYNVRVVTVNKKVLAITRGGYICPYTTARIKRIYGSRLLELSREYPSIILVGEVVGQENPYVPQYYPEAPGFDYFVFDVFKDGKLAPLKTRDEIVEKYDLKRVRVLGVLSRNDTWRLWEIVEELEREGREGIVIKDPEHKVPALKYTTIRTNIGDIREGMKYPFDEGRSYLFPRILRLIAQGYEMNWSEEQLNEIALELGKAILEPAIKSLKNRANGKLIASEYKLVFPSEEDLSDFLEYMEALGVDIVTSIIGTYEEGLVVKVMKLKQTHGEYTKILETGLSPLD